MAAPARAAQAHARGRGRAAPGAARHVVIVGISGLTWNSVTPASTPELWRLAAAGSVGSLVDYAQQPLACPADGWLTLNSAARAQGPRPCAVAARRVHGRRTAPAIPAMPQIIRDNRRYHESPDWGLLGSLASCATAVGPGAALALASPAGTVSSYLPSPADLSAVGAGPLPADRRRPGPDRGIRTGACLRRRPPARRHSGRTARRAPCCSSPLPAPRRDQAQGAAPAGPPHLMTVVVSGPGFADGLLDSSATRRPGIVTLTDLTPTVAALARPPGPGRAPSARGSAGRTGETWLRRSTSLLAGTPPSRCGSPRTAGSSSATRSADALAFGVPPLLFRGARRGTPPPPRPVLARSRACSPPPSRSAPTWRTWPRGGSWLTRPGGCTG